MPTAIDKLKDELSKFTPEELQQQFTQEELAEIYYTLTDAKCAEDPLYWGQHHSATENPHWEKQGLPFIAPFPVKSYFHPLMHELQNSRRLFIPKTREMLTSWCLMLYACHKAQWNKAEVVIQTAKEEKAGRLVEYAAILYRNQSDFLKKRHPLKRQTTLALEWADGGKLYGIPAGEDQIRMFHPSVVVYDEAAFLPGFEACWNAALPVAQQMIAISSAAPGFFGDQCTL